MSFVNELEPHVLLDAYATHMPHDFHVCSSVHDTPAFTTRFDLLTTADPGVQRRVRGWPGYRYWSRWLRPRTCFIGSNASEYAWLPGQVVPERLAEDLVQRHASTQPFLIVKDIPHDSPLLEASDNTWNAAFAAALEQHGFVLLEGQALAWVPIDFASEDDYLAARSRGARRDIRRKLRARADLEIEAVPCGSERFGDAAELARFYALYEQVQAQSEIQFDHLDAEFFRMLLTDGDSNGVVFVYRHQARMIGWNLCYVHQGRLIDKYVGFDYPQSRTHNLYAISWMHNLDYARRMGLRQYVAGWTDPEIKAHLGACFTFTRHAVRPRSGLLRFGLRRLARYFESDRQWYEGQAR
ncbi:GNAT family N-acetyltransferase [Oleiagrimonas sp.]|jgi:hypothetical protein|uniref:peptidogalycan biosysnthesis protein n=1 Tax=Oleiagrimonas sp. TaxID=2010330 RepID=UPI002610BDCB|nr:GNAT family N-acetyltransferase [Oleiagrimonas sp.]MDA3914486.1 GNAT family N-acetyltransferase [Oleiagrimonas sp.]